jgi:hypothetical protein
MTKADNDSNDIAATFTRRDAVNLIVGGAAGVTAGLATSAAAEPDPIFAAIESYKSAWAAFLEVVKEEYVLEQSATSRDDPRWEAIEKNYHAAHDVVWDAAWELIDAPPTTLEGISALCHYAHQFVKGGDVWVGPHSELGLTESWESELHRMLADAADRMLGRTATTVARTAIAVVPAHPLVKDPIFALIKTHEQSLAEREKAVAAATSTEQEDAAEPLFEQETKDLKALMRQSPTTFPGLHAMVAHLVDYTKEHRLPYGSTTDLLLTLAIALDNIRSVNHHA